MLESITALSAIFPTSIIESQWIGPGPFRFEIKCLIYLGKIEIYKYTFLDFEKESVINMTSNEIAQSLAYDLNLEVWENNFALELN